MGVALSIGNTAVIQRFGEAATYKPAAGGSVSLNAVVQRERAQTEPRVDGLTVLITLQVLILLSDVAAPLRGDVLSFPIQVGGTAVDWQVVDVPLTPGDGTARLTVHREETIERSPQDYRRPR